MSVRDDATCSGRLRNEARAREVAEVLHVYRLLGKRRHSVSEAVANANSNSSPIKEDSSASAFRTHVTDKLNAIAEPYLLGPIARKTYARSVMRQQSAVDHLYMITEYKLGDIIANAVTHGVGAALAIAGAVVLVVNALGGTVYQVASCSVFGCTLVLVYVCSTLYHSLVRTRARHVLRIIDHSAIYLLIAGTYTPFALVSLHGQLGWLLFAVVWGLAIMGIVFKSFAVGRFAIVSVVVYLGMGWLGVFATRPLLHALTWHGIFWIALGGLFYTAGIVFYALDEHSYFHAFWHLFVLGGSTCHYFGVLFYVAQPRT